MFPDGRVGPDRIFIGSSGAILKPPCVGKVRKSREIIAWKKPESSVRPAGREAVCGPNQLELIAFIYFLKRV
jgi:hypothetical protein